MGYGLGAMVSLGLANNSTKTESKDINVKNSCKKGDVL
jgi:hypothetical protein